MLRIKSVTKVCLLGCRYQYSIAKQNFQLMKYEPLSKKQIINKIFTSQSILQRIELFANFDQIVKHNGLQNNDNPSINSDNSLIIKNPPFFKFDTAKNLSLYIKQNQIPANIRILHALTHIQYNAFMSYANTYFLLAFQIQQPQKRQQFKNEIKKIALDQAEHFQMLSSRLQALGWQYGCIPVIDQLYVAIQQTKHSLLQRITRISLLHEGRGMKAISKLIKQLQKQKDHESIKILKVIQNEEVYHFQNGVKWFAYLCKIKNLNIDEICQELSKKKQFKMLNVEQIKKCALVV